MTILDTTEVELDTIITHHVGNKLNDEKYHLSNEETILDTITCSYLLKLFLSPLKPEEFYSFTHPISLEFNDVYKLVAGLFADMGDFIAVSQNIAKLLYDHSMHPKIKEGELNIVYFTNVMIDNEVVDAIGIFKSETNVPFIKMNSRKASYEINHDFGYEIKSPDKGCVIFNTDQEGGYKILLIDTTRKAEEAQYWKDDFLKLKPISNDFLQTKQFLSIAKDFVANKLAEEYEVSKADKIDYLNKSLEYFKNNDNFDKKDFEETVFQDKGLIESFRNFDEQYKAENNFEIADSFEISTSAVKKQTRVFKSVLKLDKNFHVYIHGNKDLIEQGIDKDGRKFYKLYYEEEE